MRCNYEKSHIIFSDMYQHYLQLADQKSCGEQGLNILGQ